MKLISIALFLLIIYNHDLLAIPIETEAEYKETIVKQHKDLLVKFSKSPLVVSTLVEANKQNVGIVDIMKLDANWQLNRKLQKSVMQTVLASKISEFIKNPKFDIAEMMVLDKNGVLVAVFPNQRTIGKVTKINFNNLYALMVIILAPLSGIQAQVHISFFIVF